MLDRFTIALSACLAGEPVRYDASASFSSAVDRLLQIPGVNPITCCPEMLGGLSCPRPPAEIVSRSPLSIQTYDKRDVTEAFTCGAAHMLTLLNASPTPVDLVVLKDKSPSCGIGYVYDGTFTGQLVSGDGVCAELLRAQGYVLCTQHEVATFVEWADTCVDCLVDLHDGMMFQDHPVVQAFTRALRRTQGRIDPHGEVLPSRWLTQMAPDTVTLETLQYLVDQLHTSKRS